ncbi:hypothetical protein BCF55_0889 [Hydrogenivirga caldilitoris]|uniref:Uncharacterized protein n=1 Tax=Hydrogenivirga caldilitoris TaxID=246264 RepID=A0A497XU00_9AQUI|nr:hypothetical protein [Hydrogenivirga caldilitoris]RLJ70612.1 hypothetical protein BCF55_0889 [Hydrogenivirga caldilitoris]
MFKETTILIVLSRVVEFLGIITTIFLMFRGYKLKYVYLVGGVVVLSLISSTAGLLAREYFEYIALADLLLTAGVLGGVVLYVSKNPEKARDFTPPEKCRCPVCKAIIIKEDELCTMKIGSYTYYFDSCDHLIKLMKEIDFFLERESLPFGEVKELYVKAKDTKRWKKLEDVNVVEEGGVFYAYEKVPKGKEAIALKELFNNFKEKLSRRKT